MTPGRLYQGRQFVFRSGGDNNHKLECGLKSAGYPYVSYSSIQRCITICSTVHCQMLKLFEYSNTGSENLYLKLNSLFGASLLLFFPRT